MEPAPDRTRWSALDVGLLALAAVAGAALWRDCAWASEVAGDSFVPLQCGRRFLLDGWAVPSQNIFGWGLCATFAPLFVGAESIADVAYRRAFLASLVVPAAFVTARAVLPAVTRFGLPAVRVGSLCAAAAVMFSPGVGRPSSSGGHGYLSWTWIALSVAALAVAARDPSPRTGSARVLDRVGRIVAAVVGVAAIPMAAMNHPFAVWIAAPALILLPLGVVRAGLPAVLGGLAAAWALSVPRLDVLRAKAAAGDTWESFAFQPGSERLLDPANALAWILDGPDRLLIAGFVVLVFALPFLRPKDRLLAPASWAAAAAAGLVGLVLLGREVGYLQDYHVMTMHPFAAAGVGVATGALVEGLGRASLGLPSRVRAVGAVAGAVLLVLGIAEASDIDELDRPWNVPWCPTHPGDGGTAAGVARYRHAIAQDLAGAQAPERFLITDLNLSSRSLDGSVALGLSLHMSGVDAHRMTCCSAEQTAPAWYMVADLLDPRVDWNRVAAIDGIDVLDRRNRVSELLFVVRTPEALDALGDVLCAAIPPDHVVSVNYYNDLMHVLDPGGRRLPAPSPTPPCLTRRLPVSGGGR